MAEAPYSPVTAAGSQGSCKSKAVLGFAGGIGEIIGRFIRFILALMVLVLLAVAVGLNNTSNAQDLPSFTNCSADIDSLSISYLRRSVNIFSGIFIAFAAVNFIYHLVAIALRFLAADLIEKNRKFFAYLDVIVLCIFTYVSAGGVAGSYLLAFLWSGYRGAIGDQTSGEVEEAGRGINVVLWFLYGLFIAIFSTYISGMLTEMSYAARICSKSCTKAAEGSACATELEKK